VMKPFLPEYAYIYGIVVHYMFSVEIVFFLRIIEMVLLFGCVCIAFFLHNLFPPVSGFLSYPTICSHPYLARDTGD
jgi:hypothetical protein